jgi:hypothetical protein
MSKKGRSRHIYLDRDQELILDVIGTAMGRRRLGVRASRSQLISTAVRNFIADCGEEEDLREAIEQAQRTVESQRSTDPEG